MRVTFVRIGIRVQSMCVGQRFELFMPESRADADNCLFEEKTKRPDERIAYAGSIHLFHN